MVRGGAPVRRRGSGARLSRYIFFQVGLAVREGERGLLVRADCRCSGRRVEAIAEMLGVSWSRGVEAVYETQPDMH